MSPPIVDKKIRVSEYFSLETVTKSSNSFTENVSEQYARNPNKPTIHWNEVNEERDLLKQLLETRPNRHNEKPKFSLETDRQNFFNPIFSPRSIQSNSVPYHAGAENSDTAGIATSMVTSGASTFRDTELFLSVSNQKIPEGISLQPSPSKQKSIDVYRNFSNSDFNHKDLMTLHYIFSNSEYDSSSNLVKLSSISNHMSQYCEKTKENQNTESNEPQILQNTADEHSTQSNMLKKYDLSCLTLNKNIFTKNKKKRPSLSFQKSQMHLCVEEKTVNELNGNFSYEETFRLSPNKSLINLLQAPNNGDIKTEESRTKQKQSYILQNPYNRDSTMIHYAKFHANIDDNKPLMTKEYDEFYGSERIQTDNYFNAIHDETSGQLSDITKHSSSCVVDSEEVSTNNSSTTFKKHENDCDISVKNERDERYQFDDNASNKLERNFMDHEYYEMYQDNITQYGNSQINSLDSSKLSPTQNCNLIFDGRNKYYSESKSTVINSGAFYRGNTSSTSSNQISLDSRRDIIEKEEYPDFENNVTLFRNTRDDLGCKLFDGMQTFNNTSEMYTLGEKQDSYINGCNLFKNDKEEPRYNALNCNSGQNAQFNKKCTNERQYNAKMSERSPNFHKNSCSVKKDTRRSTAHTLSQNVERKYFKYDGTQEIFKYHSISIPNNEQKNNLNMNAPENEHKRIFSKCDTRNFNQTKDVINLFDDKAMINEVEREKIVKPIFKQISMKQISLKEYSKKTLYQPVTISLTKFDIESELCDLYQNRVHHKYCAQDEQVLLLPTRLYHQPITYIIPFVVKT